MIVRKLGPGEILPALRLTWEVFARDVAPYSTPEGVGEFQRFLQYEHIQKKIEQEGMVMLGAFNGMELIGVTAILPSGHQTLLFVKKEWQRRGVGRQLFAAACQHCALYFHVPKMTVNAVPGAAEAYRHLGMYAQGPEQESGGMRYVPMEIMLMGAGKKKGWKKILLILAILASICFLGFAVFEIMDEGMDVIQEQGLMQGQPGTSFQNPIAPGTPENEPKGDVKDQEGGLGSIPVYQDEHLGYEVKKDSYVYTPKDTTTTTIHFEVYYPQIEGLDEKVQKKVNQELEDCALETVDKLYLEPSDETKEQVLGEEAPVLASLVEYKIAYQSPELISVVFQDYSYEISKDEQHVSLRTRNINLKDGTVYEVKDIVNLNDTFLQSWVKEMQDEADDDTFLTELKPEDMKAILSGEKKDEVYTPNFFVDAEGVEIGLNMRYPKGSAHDKGYAWVTAPFDWEEIQPFQSDNPFWHLAKKPTDQ